MPKPTKKELARMAVMHDMGITPTAIAKRLNKSHHTIFKYLNSDLLDDPAIKAIIDKIKETEINDLYLLGGKARQRLHALLDEGDTKAIETTAIMDRSFQQRQLLQGRATAIIDYGSTCKRIEELEAELNRLESGTIDI